MNAQLIIVTGKTASGKDTVIKRLLLDFPDFKKVLTTTSRPPRSEETDKDYNFVSKEQFERKIEKGDFIEYVEYGGNFYGTEKKQIVNNLNYGLIWRIDPSRAGQIRQFIKKAFDQTLAEMLLKKVVVFFLTTDDLSIIKRLKNRGFNDHQIQERMKQDKIFLQQFGDNYDFIVENTAGALEETVQKVIQIINQKKDETAQKP